MVRNRDRSFHKDRYWDRIDVFQMIDIRNDWPMQGDASSPLNLDDNLKRRISFTVLRFSRCHFTKNFVNNFFVGKRGQCFIRS